MKIYLENDKLEVLLSPYDVIVTEANRIRKHEISKKAKISTSAFFMYASKVMLLSNNSKHTTKSVVSFEKDYKTL